MIKCTTAWCVVGSVRPSSTGSCCSRGQDQASRIFEDTRSWPALGLWW